MDETQPEMIVSSRQKEEQVLSDGAADLRTDSRQDSVQSNSAVRNERALVCSRCGSVILTANVGAAAKRKVFLPDMTRKAALPAHPSERGSDSAVVDSDTLYHIPNVPGESMNDFWLVDDMFAFENVGFSNQVDNVKYLTCADCEIGPIGFHDVTKPREFFVARDRIKEK